jgi:choline dehydrogenase-like flavoprotein
MDPALRDRVLEYTDTTHDYDEQVDVVVIGTGCGGAVVARVLAEAGWSVLMLERGGLALAERGDFDQREDDMLAKIDGGRGLDTTDDGLVALTYGNAVGGASLHYWADTYRTPKDRCELWASRYGVQHRSYDELVPWFDKIERDLNVHDAPDQARNKMNALFVKGMDALGLPVERVPQARKNCVGSGYCMQGCAYDAKQSQLVTNLPAALAAGARIFADCRVDGIVVEDGRATGVAASFLDRRTNAPSGRTLRVRSKRAVVVAAGGFNTAPLLMKSGVPDPSGLLGEHLQMNPGFRTLGLFDEDVVMWRGIPAAVGSLDFRLARFDGDRYLGGGYQLYPDQLPPATLAALLPGFGKEHRAIMANAHRVGSVTSWTDEVGSGWVKPGADGRPVWHMPIAGVDDAMHRDAMKLHARILLAAGAREVLIPDRRGTRIRGVDEIDAQVAAVDLRPGSLIFAAPHPAGACRMGGRPEDSVVSSDGELWAVRGLFVADPSAFPTVVSVDPSETIMAWSYVTATRLLARG